jgi:hypothetical protein
MSTNTGSADAHGAGQPGGAAATVAPPGAGGATLKRGEIGLLGVLMPGLA